MAQDWKSMGIEILSAVNAMSILDQNITLLILEHGLENFLGML